MATDTTTSTAQEVAPGLLVSRLADDYKPYSPHRWRITHKDSGLAIADAMRHEDALRGAELLATLTDWTQNAEALKASVNPADLFATLSYRDCIAPASEPLAPGADASRNGTYTDEDLHREAAEFKADGYNALEILVAMTHRVPWCGLDTEPFNEAHNRIVQLAEAD